MDKLVCVCQGGSELREMERHSLLSEGQGKEALRELGWFDEPL